MVKGWLLVLIVLVGVSKIDAFSQCNLEFDYTVEVSDGEGQIFLQRKSGNGPVILKLFDVYDGKNDFIQILELRSIGERKRLVFKNLKPSTYFIQAEDKECKITIGDLGGIIVRDITK